MVIRLWYKSLHCDHKFVRETQEVVFWEAYDRIYGGAINSIGVDGKMKIYFLDAIWVESYTSSNESEA